MDIDIQELERKKRYLKRYKKNLALVSRLESKITDLDNKICNLRSPVLSDMPKGGTPLSKEDLLSDKLELEDRVERLKKKGAVYKAEILNIIDELDDTRYAEILESFFIDGKSFEDIAEDNGYTIRHIIRLYSEAIISVSV